MAAVPDLPGTVAQLRPWRAPSALLLAAEPYPIAVDALRRVGFTLTTIDPAEPAERLAELDPIGYLLIGSEAVELPASLRFLQEIRATSPMARFLLLAGPDVAAATLLAAIRAGVHEVLDPLDQISLLTELRVQVDRAAHSRERVLAVGAHPDDVELGCAGALLEHRRRGDRLSVLTLSRGAAGGDAQDRTAEACAAAGSLGSQLLLADLPDTRISEGIETISMIEQVIAVLDPTVVYVHSPHDTHQDHRAVHAATMSAARGVPTLLAYQSPSAANRFLPTAFVPIDPVSTGRSRCWPVTPHSPRATTWTRTPWYRPLGTGAATRDRGPPMSSRSSASFAG